MTDDYSHDPLDRLVRARYPPSRRTLRRTSDLSGGTHVRDVLYSFDALGSEILPADAFAEPLAAPTAGNRFSFTLLRQGYGRQAGREWLSDLGLYDYRHRAYSPLLGRWLRPDPIGFAGGDVNLHRYCANGPIAWRDPWGWQVGHTFVQTSHVADCLLARQWTPDRRWGTPAQHERILVDATDRASLHQMLGGSISEVRLREYVQWLLYDQLGLSPECPNRYTVVINHYFETVAGGGRRVRYEVVRLRDHSGRDLTPRARSGTYVFPR